MNPPNTQQLQHDIETLTATLRDLAELLPLARDAQWDRSPVPRPRADTGERPHGGPPSDPTSETALDERRLALRAAVIRAETLISRAVVGTAVVRDGLEKALAEWEGIE